MKELKLSSIIICSIVRNAETGLKRNIPVINKLCSYFKEYKIIVYENDSKDSTKSILKKWQATDTNNIHISINDINSSRTIPHAGEVKSNPFFCRRRIEKMVNLRNNYLEYIEKENWKADYVIIVDLDVAQLSLEGILSSFKTNIEWDAVTSFGYSTSPKLKRRYHDTYALTMWGDEDNPQTEKKIKEYADKLGNLKITDKWLRVFSAFGGLAIYKFEAIIGLRYMLIENNDSRVEVKCEHYSIYKQMKDRGYERVYINPAMTLKYQDVDLQIICKKLISFLRSKYWSNLL